MVSNSSLHATSNEVRADYLEVEGPRIARVEVDVDFLELGEVEDDSYYVVLWRFAPDDSCCVVDCCLGVGLLVFRSLSSLLIVVLLLLILQSGIAKRLRFHLALYLELKSVPMQPQIIKVVTALVRPCLAIQQIPGLPFIKFRRTPWVAYYSYGNGSGRFEDGSGRAARYCPFLLLIIRKGVRQGSLVLRGGR